MKSPDMVEANPVYVDERTKLEKLTDYEKTLHAMLDAAREHSKHVFATEDEANEAGDEFMAEWHEELAATLDDEYEPRVTVSGEGILVPNLEIILDGSTTMIEADEEDPLNNLEYPETETGRLDSIFRTSALVGGNDQYGSMIYMSLALESSPVINIQTSGFPMAIVSGKLQVRAFVELTNSSVHIEVPEREELERENEVIAAIAKSGLTHSRMMKVIEEIETEMYEDGTRQFKILGDTERIKWLARQCVEAVNQEICSMDVLADRLKMIFRKGRPLILAKSKEVEYDEYGDSPDVAEGRVEELYFKVDNEGKAQSLHLAIESLDDDGVAFPQHIQMDHVEELHF